MGQKEKYRIDIHKKAEAAGIASPVVIDSSLLKMMTPNSYLASIGVSLEERIENLLRLVKANLHTGKDSEKSEKAEKKYYIPFMVLKGPHVKEEFLSVIVNVETKGEDRTVITLSQADNGDSGVCAV